MANDSEHNDAASIALERSKQEAEEWEKFRKEVGLPTVDKFGKAMKQKLVCKFKEKGGWDNCTLEWLFLYLKTEVLELEKALLERDRGHIGEEAVDVANLAMMIWDVCRRPQQKPVMKIPFASTLSPVVPRSEGEES